MREPALVAIRACPSGEVVAGQFLFTPAASSTTSTSMGEFASIPIIAFTLRQVFARDFAFTSSFVFAFYCCASHFLGLDLPPKLLHLILGMPMLALLASLALEAL
jgi:hypothetical protein